MASYSIDTAEAITRLEETGLSHDQAQAIVATFAKSNEQVATKADLEVLKSHLSLRIYSMAGLVVAAPKILEYLQI